MGHWQALGTWAADEDGRRRVVSIGVAAAVFTTFIGYYGLLCLHPAWGGDFQLYCAGVARLYRDMLHPLHEALNLPSNQSTVYTPFLVGVALLGKLFGVTPYRALQVAGVFNLGLFAAGSCFLFSRISIHRQWWLPAACFIFTTLCLRWLHFGWSSETSLTNLQYIQPFPSTFAWALALFAFGLLKPAHEQTALRDRLILCALLSLLLSSHVLTASWVVGIVGLHGLWTAWRSRDFRPIAWTAAVLMAALLPLLLWPYASFFGQSSLQGVREGSYFGRSPLVEFPNLYALGLACFAYSITRLRRHGFWLLGLCATLGALLVWRQLGISYGNRYAFFAAFFPQLIVAEVMALGIMALVAPVAVLEPSRRFKAWDRPISIALFLAACVAWLPSPMFEKARQRTDFGTLWTPAAVLARGSAHDAYYAQFSDVRPFISAQDVVLMPVSRAVLDLASVSGASVVSTPLVLQVVDGAERFHAVARFFDPKTRPAARLQIAAEYGASKVLVPRRHFPLVPELIESFGEPLYRGNQHVLFGVPARSSWSGP